MRKNGTYDSPRNRTSVGDEYGAGNLEKESTANRGVLRRGGKRDFSPYLNRGLGESHSTCVRSTSTVRSTRTTTVVILVREKSLWTLFG